MKKIILTKYEAIDGERFSTKKECEEYESDECVRLVPIPVYCDHTPLTAENIRYLASGDGSLYYATQHKYSPRIPVFRDRHPAWATHLVYFGK